VLETGVAGEDGLLAEARALLDELPMGACSS
jgi:hypothetical protein